MIVEELEGASMEPEHATVGLHAPAGAPPEVHEGLAAAAQCGCAEHGRQEQVVAAQSPLPGPARIPMADPGPAYVYAIGSIEARFPSLSVEKEFAQATRGGGSASHNDQQTFRMVLDEPGNRYLARQLCWVLTVRGMDTYVLRPRDPADFELLVQSIRAYPSPLDVDAVIGHLGPLASPETCNGLSVPMVAFDQIYSFDRASFADAVPRDDDLSPEQNAANVDQVLGMILRIADNAGSTDEHRALNYLAMRYADIYTKTGQQFAADFAFTGIEVRPSPLGGDRKVVECVFTYTNRQSAFTERYMVPVDVTEEFPFLVAPLAPHYDRVTQLQ